MAENRNAESSDLQPWQVRGRRGPVRTVAPTSVTCIDCGRQCPHGPRCVSCKNKRNGFSAQFKVRPMTIEEAKGAILKSVQAQMDKGYQKVWPECQP